MEIYERLSCAAIRGSKDDIASAGPKSKKNGRLKDWAGRGYATSARKIST